MLIGPEGLNLPVAALTDYDPRKPKKDGTPRSPLGPKRVVDQMVIAIVDEKTWNANNSKNLLKMAPDKGIFMNSHTFEVDLFTSGLADEFVETMNFVGTHEAMKKRMQDWAGDIDSLDVDLFLKDIETVGKGRFAQRLACIITESGTEECPEYIVNGVKYVADRC